MIISRTPFRVSFFGGGTDYPDWYLKHGGGVLATAINKYCYISCRYLPPFFEHKIRLVYSRIENCQTPDDIQHPSVRACLKYLELERGLEIHHDGDLPARSGMGSSSSFTVGLLHALHGLLGRMPSKHELASQAIHVEQKILEETVGSQDQIMAAYGGLNHVTFMTSGEISVRPVTISRDCIQELESHLLLFYSGIKRTASNVAASYANKIESRSTQLRIMRDMVEEALSILSNGSSLDQFGNLLHEAWLTKRSLSDKVSNTEVDQMYEAAREAGALGGKLTGAGGGGFMLVFAPPNRHQNIIESLRGTIHVPFKLDFTGTRVIFHDHEEDYSTVEAQRFNCEPVVFRELMPEEDKTWS